MSELISVSAHHNLIYASSADEDRMVVQQRISMPAASKAKLHAQFEVCEEPTSPDTPNECSSWSTGFDLDDFQLDCQNIDSDLDGLEELDRQADAAYPKTKKLAFDDHVTYIEPDVNTVVYHWANKEERETARAWKRSVRAHLEIAQQWQAYQWQLHYWQQWQQCSEVLQFQAGMFESQLALSHSTAQSAHPGFDVTQREDLCPWSASTRAHYHA